MPYETLSQLPKAVQKLPHHAQEIWQSAFNSAFQQYGGDEAKTNATAWAAVGKLYHKDSKGEWVANEIKAVPMAVKFLDEEKGLIEGCGEPYGGPMQGKDLVGEYFTAQTDFCNGWFPKWPLLYHHGLDAAIKAIPIGEIYEITPTEKGNWWKAQLDKSNAYWEQIKQLIKAGKLLFSSGAVPHLVQRGEDGEIKRWPRVEGSLTVSPANPFATVDSFKAIAGLKAIGITEDKLKVIQAKATKAEPEVTEDYIRIRLKDPDLFQPERFRTIDISESEGIHAVIGRLKGETTTTVQAYLFDKDKWTEGRASTWVEEHKKETKAMEKPKDSPEFVKNPTHAAAEIAEFTGDKPKLAEATKAIGCPVCEHCDKEDCPYAVKTFSCKVCEHCDKDSCPHAVKAIRAVKGALCAVCPHCLKEACPHTVKAVSAVKQTELPESVQRALLALHDSIEAIMPDVCTMEGVAAAAEETPPPTTPGISQGMAPETHVTKTETVPPVKPEERKEPPKSEAAVSENITKSTKALMPDAIKALFAEQDNSLKASVREAVKPLEERLTRLESKPASNGPVRRAIKGDVNPKMDIPEGIDMAAIDKILADPETPVAIKSYLGERAAAQEMKEIMRREPQPLRRGK